MQQECTTNMQTRQDYINIIRNHSQILQHDYGVQSLCLFGSVARDEHTTLSDVDVLVDMPADMRRVVAAQQYLESLLGCPVDLVRRHPYLSEFFLDQVSKYGITVFPAS